MSNNKKKVNTMLFSYKKIQSNHSRPFFWHIMYILIITACLTCIYITQNIIIIYTTRVLTRECNLLLYLKNLYKRKVCSKWIGIHWMAYLTY